MVTVTSLWLPILLAAVLVFVVSSLIHMLLGYHAGDYGPLPDEARAADALRDVPPGDYAVPHAGSMKEFGSPEYKAKLERGPVAFMTVRPKGPHNMATQFVLWFLYSVAIGVFAAYVAGRSLGPGAEYGAVFRYVGTTAFIGYAVAMWQDSIWYGRKWSTTAKYTLDGAIYALLTAGVFGWLWPG